MKYIPTILLAILLFSCQKEVAKIADKKNLVLEEDDFGVSKSARVIHIKKRRPPTDTVIATPPVTTTTYAGKRLLHIDANGGNVNNVWGNFYASPATGLTQPQLQIILDTTIKAYSFVTNTTITLDEGLFNLCPLLYRQKVILTDSYEWYGNAGGVAYRNSFGTDVPAFVFTSLLSNNTKWVGIATVHELGHTLGLPHPANMSGTSQFCNWMGSNYYSLRHGFEENVLDANGMPWNQFLTIENTVK